jgi:hypothetical protein
MKPCRLAIWFLVSSSSVSAQDPTSAFESYCYELVARWTSDQEATKDSLLKPGHFSLVLLPSRPAVMNAATFQADSAAGMDSASALWRWDGGWVLLEARTRSDSIGLSLRFPFDSSVYGFAERRVRGGSGSMATLTGRQVPCESVRRRTAPPNTQMQPPGRGGPEFRSEAGSGMAN